MSCKCSRPRSPKKSVRILQWRTVGVVNKFEQPHRRDCQNVCIPKPSQLHVLMVWGIYTKYFNKRCFSTHFRAQNKASDKITLLCTVGGADSFCRWRKTTQMLRYLLRVSNWVQILAVTYIAAIRSLHLHHYRLNPSEYLAAHRRPIIAL